MFTHFFIFLFSLSSLTLFSIVYTSERDTDRESEEARAIYLLCAGGGFRPILTSAIQQAHHKRTNSSKPRPKLPDLLQRSNMASGESSQGLST